MTEEELIGIQNTLFEAAKDLLLENGEAYPIGYVIAPAGGENGVLEEGRHQLQLLGKNPSSPSDDDPGYSLLVVDMQPTDGVLLQQLLFMHPEIDEPVKGAVQMGVDVFRMSRELAITKTLNVLLDKGAINRKDVVARMVKELCRSTKAFAFIHVCEAYGAELTIAEYRELPDRSLAEDPRSIECLMSTMVGHNFRRMLMSPINRELAPEGDPKDSGKVISVTDPPKEIIDRGSDIDKLGGRFMEVLQPVD